MIEYKKEIFIASIKEQENNEKLQSKERLAFLINYIVDYGYINDDFIKSITIEEIEEVIREFAVCSEEIIDGIDEESNNLNIVKEQILVENFLIGLLKVKSERTKENIKFF